METLQRRSDQSLLAFRHGARCANRTTRQRSFSSRADGRRLSAYFGYSVAACRSGRDALALFEAEPDSFTAVVTDWQMSGMHGMELVTRLRSVRDNIPVVVCSGIGEDNAVRDEMGIRSWLTKPYTFESLDESLQNAIQNRIG